MGINLPRMNGLELQEELNRTVPYASIVFITGHNDLPLGMRAMKRGAVDVLEKPIDDETLLNSVARGAYLSRKRRAEHNQRIELEKRYGCLTPRECEVFDLITAGLLNKQVGARLGTTERTVKAHRERVMSKMLAGSLADLVRMADVLQIHPARAQAAQPDEPDRRLNRARNAAWRLLRATDQRGPPCSVSEMSGPYFETHESKNHDPDRAGLASRRATRGLH